MKKLFCLIFIIFSLCPSSFSAEKHRPDPLYINSEVLDAYADESPEKHKLIKKSKKPKKQKKPMSFNERFRKLFHLPPAKTTYYHNIDKSKIPVTMDDYYNFAQDIPRSEYEIPEPEFEFDEDFKFPDPKFRLVKYNTPAGSRNINNARLLQNNTASSAALLSPDKTKMIYTKSFFYPQTVQTASAAYLIPVKGTFKSAYDILYKTNNVQGSPEPIFTAGIERLHRFKFTSLSPIDFSSTGRKAAFKEKIGSNADGAWITNIIIYDFEDKSAVRLSELRNAIVRYWRINKHIELRDFMWDIYPLGWDKKNSDRLLSYAYAYTQDKPVFLGLWRIDSRGVRAELISEHLIDADIELNGFGLLELKYKN